MTLKELREKRAGLFRQMGDMNATAEKEDRGLTPQEKSQWDGWCNEIDTIEERIERAIQLETQSEREDRNQANHDLADFESRQRGRKGAPETDPSTPLSERESNELLTGWGFRKRDSRFFELARRANFDPFAGEIDLVFHRGFDRFGNQFKAPRSIAEAEKQAEARAEQRAQSLTAAAGGHTVPNEMMRSLEIALLQWGGVRQNATVYSTQTGANLPIPTTNDTSNKGEIIDENAAVNEQDVVFGQLVLKAFKYSSKMIKVSVELLQDTSISLPDFLGDALGTRIGRITNEHFTTGAGTTLPWGLTARAANSGVTFAANTPTYSEVLTLKHAVNPAYRTNGKWMFADNILLRLKKMVDDQNRPLWLPSLIPGEPPTFDGDPYIINQDMPTAISTKGMLYGDFSKYIVREVKGVTLLRLDERFAELHQVAFLAFARYDGDLLNAGVNPVAYATLAAT